MNVSKQHFFIDEPSPQLARGPRSVGGYKAVPTFFGVNGATASCCSCAFSRREDSACSGAFSTSIWCFPSASLPSSVECWDLGVNGAAGPAGIDGAERDAWAPGSSAGRRSCGETGPRPSSALDRGLLSDSLQPIHPHCHAFPMGCAICSSGCAVVAVPRRSPRHQHLLAVKVGQSELDADQRRGRRPIFLRVDSFDPLPQEIIRALAIAVLVLSPLLLYPGIG